MRLNKQQLKLCLSIIRHQVQVQAVVVITGVSKQYFN